jgi:hypothetical protein
VRYLSHVESSTGPAEILTEQGRCYLKALGNKVGPHALAADWVGTALADWLGLRTFAAAKLRVLADDDIPIGHNRSAEPGMAIAFKAEAGASWGGSLAELQAVTNPQDAGLLILLDTWLLNCDRYPPNLDARKPNWDNVFLSAQEAPTGRFHFTAFDHTHCFSCGRNLDANLARIDNVKDPRVYGNFPQFADFLDRDLMRESALRLGTISRTMIESLVGDIDSDWQVSSAGRRALVELVYERAGFVSSMFVGTLFP